MKMVHMIPKEARVTRVRPSMRFSTRKPAVVARGRDHTILGAS